MDSCLIISRFHGFLYARATHWCLAHVHIHSPTAFIHSPSRFQVRLTTFAAATCRRYICTDAVLHSGKTLMPEAPVATDAAAHPRAEVGGCESSPHAYAPVRPQPAPAYHDHVATFSGKSLSAACDQ